MFFCLPHFLPFVACVKMFLFYFVSGRRCHDYEKRVFLVLQYFALVVTYWRFTEDIRISCDEEEAPHSMHMIANLASFYSSFDSLLTVPITIRNRKHMHQHFVCVCSSNSRSRYKYF